MRHSVGILQKKNLDKDLPASLPLSIMSYKYFPVCKERQYRISGYPLRTQKMTKNNCAKEKYTEIA